MIFQKWRLNNNDQLAMYTKRLARRSKKIGFKEKLITKTFLIKQFNYSSKQHVLTKTSVT